MSNRTLCLLIGMGFGSATFFYANQTFETKVVLIAILITVILVSRPVWLNYVRGNNGD